MLNHKLFALPPCSQVQRLTAYVVEASSFHDRKSTLCTRMKGLDGAHFIGIAMPSFWVCSYVYGHVFFYLLSLSLPLKAPSTLADLFFFFFSSSSCPQVSLHTDLDRNRRPGDVSSSHEIVQVQGSRVHGGKDNRKSGECVAKKNHWVRAQRPRRYLHMPRQTTLPRLCVQLQVAKMGTAQRKSRSF